MVTGYQRRWLPILKTYLLRKYGRDLLATKFISFNGSTAEHHLYVAMYSHRQKRFLF